MTETCLIFGAGEYGGLTLPPALLQNSLIIAADGGFRWLSRQGVTPHLAVGDFDSLGYVPEGVETLRHPPEKDDTDMMLAVLEGEARGCTRFLLFGGSGGRLDHTVANLHLLARLAEGGKEGYLVGPEESCTVLRSGVLTFPLSFRGTLSAFAWGGEARGVTLRGLKYPLTDGILTPCRPLGVSNEFLGIEAEVSVRKGALLLVWTGTELPEERKTHHE